MHTIGKKRSLDVQSFRILTFRFEWSEKIMFLLPEILMKKLVKTLKINRLFDLTGKISSKR